MKIAPKHLTPEAKRIWRQLLDEFGIDDEAGLLITQTALEAFDRMRDAQAAIKRDGAAVTDRWGQIKPHPLLNTERDARGQMLQALKALHLDIEPLRDRAGRPSGSGKAFPALRISNAD